MFFTAKALILFSFLLSPSFFRFFSFFSLSGISVTIGNTYTDIDDHTDIEYFKNIERSLHLFDSAVSENEKNVITNIETEVEIKGENKEKLSGTVVAQEELDEGDGKRDESSVSDDVRDVPPNESGSFIFPPADASFNDSVAVESLSTASFLSSPSSASAIPNQLSTLPPFIVAANQIGNMKYESDGIQSCSEKEILAFKRNCYRTRDFINSLIL